MSTLNRMPTFQEALTQKGATTRGWYTFWTGLLSGQPTSTPVSVTVGTSPFSYVAPLGGTVILQGGTTSAVSISRDGLTFYLTGVTAGCFPLSQGDTLKVTYTVGPPTMTFMPR
jgi:hypothetical protein